MHGAPLSLGGLSPLGQARSQGGGLRGLAPQSIPIHRDANRQTLANCSQVPFRFHLSVLSLLLLIASKRPYPPPRSGPQQSVQKHPNRAATSWDVPNYDCRGGTSVFENGENSVSYQIHDGGTPF